MPARLPPARRGTGFSLCAAGFSPRTPRPAPARGAPVRRAGGPAGAFSPGAWRGLGAQFGEPTDLAVSPGMAVTVKVSGMVWENSNGDPEYATTLMVMV